VTEAAARVGKLEVPPDALTRRLEPAFEAATRIATEHSRTIREISEESQRVIRTLGGVAEGAEALRDKLTLAVSPLGELAAHASGVSAGLAQVEAVERSVSRLGAGIADVLQAMDSQVHSTSRVSSELEAQLTSVRQLRSQLEEEVRRAAESLELMHRQLVDSATYLSQALRK
jgi:uncharacterized phage infection (PIP) family protein YhgE